MYCKIRQNEEGDLSLKEVELLSDCKKQANNKYVVYEWDYQQRVYQNEQVFSALVEAVKYYEDACEQARKRYPQKGIYAEKHDNETCIRYESGDLDCPVYDIAIASFNEAFKMKIDRWIYQKIGDVMDKNTGKVEPYCIKLSCFNDHHYSREVMREVLKGSNKGFINWAETFLALDPNSIEQVFLDVATGYFRDLSFNFSYSSNFSSYACADFVGYAMRPTGTIYIFYQDAFGPDNAISQEIQRYDAREYKVPDENDLPF